MLVSFFRPENSAVLKSIFFRMKYKKKFSGKGKLNENHARQLTLKNIHAMA